MGKCALLILDLCFKEELAETIPLTDFPSHIPDPKMVIFMSAISNEVSHITLSLFERPLFPLFFASSLKASSSLRGNIALKPVYDACSQCCLAFSSLLISYSNEKGLKWSPMQVTLKQFDLKLPFRELLETYEQVDYHEGVVDRFQFVKTYYDYSKKPVIIHDKCQAWLDDVSSPDGSLDVLKKYHLFEDQVGQRLLLVSMVYSMGSFFMACDERRIISETNTFIVAFVHVLAALDKVYLNIVVDIDDMIVALQCYLDLLNKHRFQVGSLKSLLASLVQEKEQEH